MFTPRRPPTFYKEVPVDPQRERERIRLKIAALEKKLRYLEVEHGVKAGVTPEIAECLFSLAGCHEALGNQEEQKTLLERSLVISRAMRAIGLGDDNLPQILMTLADCKALEGDLERRRILLEEAVKCYQILRDPGCEWVAGGKLAQVYGMSETHQEKLKELFVRLLEIIDRGIGPAADVTRPDMPFILTGLSRLVVRSEKIRLLQRGLTEVVPEFTRMAFLNNLFLAHRTFNDNDLTKAIEILEEMKCVYQTLPGGEAAEMNRESFEGNRQLLRNTIPPLQRAAKTLSELKKVAQTAFERNEYETAITHWSAAKDLVEPISSVLLEAKQMTLIELYNHLSKAFIKQEKWQQAIEQLNNILSCYERLKNIFPLSKEDIRSRKQNWAAHMNQLGICYYKRYLAENGAEDLEKAIHHFRQALECFEALEQNSPLFFSNLADLHWNLSSCYLRQQNHPATLLHAEKAYQQWQRNLGEVHAFTIKAKARMDLCAEQLSAEAALAGIKTLRV